MRIATSEQTAGVGGGSLPGGPSLPALWQHINRLKSPADLLTVGRDVAAMVEAGEVQKPDAVDRLWEREIAVQRNFTMQAEVLAKLQRGGKQKVIVEHVHVYQGGQAIVGTVTHPGATGGIFQNGNQPHAISNDATLALSDDATVPCADPQREAVPVPSGDWKETLPDARRGDGIRRAKGRA